MNSKYQQGVQKQVQKLDLDALNNILNLLKFLIDFILCKKSWNEH